VRLVDEFNPGLMRKVVDQIFSLQWCRENIVVPIQIEDRGKGHGGNLVIAVGNFSYLATVGEFIKQRVKTIGCEAQFVERESVYINNLIDNLSGYRLENDYGESGIFLNSQSFVEILNSNDSQEQSVVEFEDSYEQIIEDRYDDLSVEMLGSYIQKACAVLLIDTVRCNVTDIHITPRVDKYTISVRSDGVMHGYSSLPRNTGIQLTACLKNMASMDIAERQASQDGKILRQFEGQKIEIRCSTAPSKHGERMVLRILDSNKMMLNLDNLIINYRLKDAFREMIHEANGLVIVCGPTGSGKSTTLAAALQEIDSGNLNIVTAEDPIEYDLGGNIAQFPVLRSKGQTFSNLLRTFLRQDPDVILIGETRDPETAESILDAAETGHLVFTTLHANSTASAITRLMDMEIPSYKICASVRGALAQRLVRLVCPDCSTIKPLDEDESAFLGLRKGTPIRIASALTAEDKYKRLHEGTLCATCGGIGYRGRIAAFELLEMTPAIRKAIREGRTMQEIEDIAVEEGMHTLKSYGAELIERQLTTVSEVYKILF